MVHRHTSPWTGFKIPEQARSELHTHPQARRSDPVSWEGKKQALGLLQPSHTKVISGPLPACPALMVQRLGKQREVLQETCSHSSLFVFWWWGDTERAKQSKQKNSKNSQSPEPRKSRSLRCQLTSGMQPGLTAASIQS